VKLRTRSAVRVERSAPSRNVCVWSTKMPTDDARVPALDPAPNA
jgi:hypothetical protein